MLSTSMVSVGAREGWPVRSIECRRKLCPHVVDDVAVEHPIARAFRHPSHIEGVVSIDKLRHHLAALCRTEKVLGFAIAYRVHIKIETVQVHGMTEGRGIDDAPMLRLSYRREQALGIGPRFAIQGKGGMEVAVVEISGPDLNDKNPVVRGGTGSVHNKGA